ncbi:MAG: lactate dehydrogenase [Clostridiales bacterium GWE2_32_10]|nr:MAG: lactate dehydrogenase [Clostridiales bacterium GWE2_32_10]HBY19964.1 DNA modification methylase [Clostridiales bacterium]
MKIEKMRLEDLKPADYNPRKQLTARDEEYQALKKSIERFGLVDPVIFNERNNTLVGGHQRLTVLKDLGYTEIETVIVDMSPEEEKALNIALNKIEGKWDNEKLEVILSELRLVGMEDLTGFNIAEINELIGEKEINEDKFDVDEEIPDEPISREGDIWLLGEHRVICGDATKKEDIEKLMDGKVADMIVTDPPYNVDYEGTAGKIKNDHMESDKFYEFLYKAYSNMLNSIKAGGPIYVFHADNEGINFRKAMMDAGFELKQCLVWVKNSLILGHSDYHWRHELILYGWKPGEKHCFYGGRKYDTLFEQEEGIKVRKLKEGYNISLSTGEREVIIKVKDFEVVKGGDDDYTTTWYVDKPNKSSEHPTMKPLRLVAKAIQNSARKGEIVLDVFGGSGSTLIASEQTGNIAYLSELDPKFVDVIVKRYEKHKVADDEIYLIRNGEKTAYRELKKA